MRRFACLLFALVGACSSAGEPAPEKKRVAPVAPPPKATALPPNPVVRVLVGGDVIPHRPSLLEPARIEAALAPLGPLFQGADATIVNFEASTGARTKKLHKMQYVAEPAWLGALARVGVDAVTVANNHACDAGSPGILATLDGAATAGLLPLGASAEGTPLVAREVFARDGLRVCAIAWSSFVNVKVGGCPRNAHLANAPTDVDVLTAVRRAKERCAAVVAIAHGGDEYEPQTAAMRSLARSAAEVGADAVVMHHPHVVSPLEVHRTRDGRLVPLFASVGNLATNQGESWKPAYPAIWDGDRHRVSLNGWTRLGMIADLRFEREGSKRAVKTRFGYHLVWVDNEHATNRNARVPAIGARLLDPEKDARIIHRLREDEGGPAAAFDDACWVEAGRPGCGLPSAS